MTLLIACLLIHGFGMAHWWYIVASVLWIWKVTIFVLKETNESN